MKVAVFGDPMRDVYWCGTAERLSPEAPIPVVKVKEKLEFPGGAANVAANLEELDVKVVKGYNSLVCPVKNRLMVGDHQVARWDEKDECGLNNTSIDLTGVEAVVVSDYGKGGITEQVRRVLVNLRLPLFVDTKGNPNAWISPTTVALFPNQKEYEKYQEEYDEFGLCVLKQGSLGLTLLSRGQRWVYMPARAKKVVSVSGAGDTVLASFVWKYLKEDSWESKANRAATFANAAAAVAVGKSWTSTVTLTEIERFQNDY